MTNTASVSSKDICQPRHGACRLNRWAAWNSDPTVQSVKRPAWSAELPRQSTQKRLEERNGEVGPRYTIQGVSVQALPFLSCICTEADTEKAKTSC